MVRSCLEADERRRQPACEQPAGHVGHECRREQRKRRDSEHAGLCATDLGETLDRHELVASVGGRGDDDHRDAGAGAQPSRANALDRRRLEP